MVEVLLLVSMCLVAGSNLLLWRQLRRMERRGGGAEAPAEVGEGAKRLDPIDEGFENLMTFSVMGKTGFEREEA